MAVGEYLGNGNPDGTSLGQSGELISFYGTAPVAQLTLSAACTTTVVSTGAFGFATSDQAAAAIALLNDIRAALVTYGLSAT